MEVPIELHPPGGNEQGQHRCTDYEMASEGWGHAMTQQANSASSQITVRGANQLQSSSH